MPMTVHFTPAQEERLQHLAKHSGRTPDDLAQEAIESYLKHIESLTAEVRDGEESAEREGWLTTDEVFARVNKSLLKTA